MKRCFADLWVSFISQPERMANWAIPGAKPKTVDVVVWNAFMALMKTWIAHGEQGTKTFSVHGAPVIHQIWRMEAC